MRLIWIFLCLFSSLFAHSVEHSFKEGAMAVQLLLGSEPASFAPYTLYAPNASLPFQEGQSDKNGIVAFAPDRTGMWKLVATPGSDHGGHLFNISFEVDQNHVMVWESAPLFTKYAQIISGISLIVGFFGLLLAWKARLHVKKERG
jgi:nickel transport protein